MHESGICSFRIFHHRIIHISDPVHLSHILNTAPEKYTQSRDRDHMKLLFGDGLLTTTGPHWKKQRALIQPCFGRNQVADMVGKINKQLTKRSLNTGKIFDLHAWSLDTVNAIMADIIFSDNSEETLAIGNELVDLKADTLARLRDYSLPLWIPTSGNLAFKKRRAAVYGAINRKIVSGLHSNVDLLNAFTSAKDSAGKGMKRKELAEELLGVYAAAHEPVAIALTYALKLIAEHPQVSEKLRAELNGSDQPYLKQVIRESLRLYPPVWISGKRAIADDEINGFLIRKNDNIIYSPMILHRNPQYWSEAEKFMPERFNENHHPLAWLPFGGGQKFCVGSHLALTILQLAVGHIVKNYELEPDPANEVSINPFTTLKPLTELRMKAKRVSVEFMS
jgi:cytochrome P450